MGKESINGIDVNEIFRASFNSEQDVVSNGGVITGSPSFSSGEADFTSTDSDKITYPNVLGIKSVAFFVELDTLTENIVNFDGGTHTITTSNKIISATGFSSPTIYVDGVVTSSITTAKSLVVVTTATAFDATAFEVGIGLNGKLDTFLLFNEVLSSQEVSLLYENKLYAENNSLCPFLVADYDFRKPGLSDQTENVTTALTNNNSVDLLHKDVILGASFRDSATAYLSLSGANSTPFNLGLDDFAIEVWFKTHDVTTEGILGKYEGSNDRWYLRLDGSGRYQFFSLVSGVTILSALATPAYVTSTWGHVIFVVDRDASAKFYVNGAEVAGSRSDTGANLDNDGNLRIGHVESPSEYFDGTIFRTRFYKFGVSGLPSTIDKSVSQLYREFKLSMERGL